MTIMHEINTCDGALVEMTVGDTTIYSYNREEWYTDLVEVLRTARFYWMLKTKRNSTQNRVAGMMFEKIDRQLIELLPPKGLFGSCAAAEHDYDYEWSPPRCNECGEPDLT